MCYSFTYGYIQRAKLWSVEDPNFLLVLCVPFDTRDLDLESHVTVLFVLQVFI